MTRQAVRKKKPANTRMRSDPRLAGTAEVAVRETETRVEASRERNSSEKDGAVISVDQKVSRAETVPVVFLKS